LRSSRSLIPRRKCRSISCKRSTALFPGGNVNISGNSVPTIDTRYIRTNVSAANGSTIVLGGLIEDQKQKNYQGLSLSLAHSPHWRGIPFHSEWQAASRTDHSHVSRGDLDELDLYRLRQKWENTHTHFGPELDQAECPDCPKVETGKQINLPPPDLPEGKDMH
jgi:Type II secretory pathway, component PulD